MVIKTNKIMEKLVSILKAGWPVIIAIMGGIIMIGAGANECAGCNIAESLVGMDDWGWVGLVLIILALGFGVIRIVVAFKNGFDQWKS